MLRHIVPVLRNGCTINAPRALRTLVIPCTRISPLVISDHAVLRSFHVQAVQRSGIKNPDDLSETPIELFDVDAEPTNSTSQGDNETTVEDLEVMRAHEVTPNISGNKKQKKKSSGPEAPVQPQAPGPTRRERKKIAAQNRAEKKAAKAAKAASIAEAMATGAADPSKLGKSGLMAAEGDESADALKEGAVQVVKNVLESENIPTKSLKKKSDKNKKKQKKGDQKDKKKEASSATKPQEPKPPQQPQQNKKARPSSEKNTINRPPAEEDKIINVTTLKAREIEFKQVEQGEEVAKLHYGLERVLFNPGVYQLQDPRSGVYNFDPFLAKIMPVDEFDFRALKEYITSSKDTNLASKARAYNKKFSGSTSSMTSTLSQFHFLISNWRPISISTLSRDFKADSLNYTRITRSPSAAFLHYNNGTYAMDADKEFDSPNILSMLGKSMEKLLTLPQDKFERYHRSRSSEISQEERDAEEAFSFSTLGDWMVRSQLDANDPRLPGVGNFDLKTRAVVSIRMDTEKFKEMNGYEIHGRFGNWESYEREYYDMIRSAFLKYSLQVRMGMMDGIFVAYHNTNRIFGFQYISLNEMDMAIHGTHNTELGDAEFRLSLRMLNDILNIVTEKYPEQSLRLHVETRPTTPPLMYFFAEPVTKEQIDTIQNASKEKIARFENEMMAYNDEPVKTAEEEAPVEEEVINEDENAAEETEETSAEEEDGPWSSVAVWEELTSKAEDAVESDELGLAYVRKAIQVALRQSGLLKDDTTGEQGREYVSDLLEALTGTQGEGEDLEAGVEGLVEEPISEDAAMDQLVTEDAIIDIEEAEPEATENVESEESETIDIDEIQESDELSRPEHPGQSSLKDLIRHMAEQVDDYNKPPSTEEIADESTNKLHSFARILSELVARNRSKAAAAETSDTTVAEPPKGPLTGFIITMKNKVGKGYVSRVNSADDVSRWNLEYNIQEMEEDRAWRLYSQVQDRRRKALVTQPPEPAENISKFAQAYTEMLKNFSYQGRVFRAKTDRKDIENPVYFLQPNNKDVELNWVDIFKKPSPWPKRPEGKKKEGNTEVDESLKSMEALVVEDEDLVVETQEEKPEEEKPQEEKQEEK